MDKNEIDYKNLTRRQFRTIFVKVKLNEGYTKIKLYEYIRIVASELPVVKADTRFINHEARLVAHVRTHGLPGINKYVATIMAAYEHYTRHIRNEASEEGNQLQAEGEE